MPILTDLKPSAPWREIKATPDDWAAADPHLLGSMLTNLHVIRAFEETVLEFASEGLMHGPAHSSIGQEGGAVGSCLPLRASDQVNGSHRGHHQFLGKALGYVAPEGLDPVRDLPEVVPSLLRRTLAEIAGLAEGFCKGRGGSMHLRWAEAGALGTNAIIGGGVPMAAGAAMAHKRAGTGDVVVTYFGDGAVNIGSVLETMNLAAAWSLPLLFFIENNLYAVATHIDEATREPRLSSRGLGFAIPAWRVDGMDPLAVKLATDEALAHMRAGNGPAIIEAEVYRYFHQSGALPGSAFGYRPKEEEEAWRARDPLEQTARAMIDRKLLTKADVEALRDRIKEVMTRCAEALTEPAGNRRKVRDELWPSPDFRDFGIRGDLSELKGVRTAEETQFGGAVVERKFVDVIADVLHRRMDTDPSIILMGEDIHRLKGGTNGATRGLAQSFPDRVLGTPISENAFAGLAGGLAMDGRHKPVIEFMYPDFMWVAADQVFNQIAKARHMFGGDTDMPLVLRTKVAMGTGYGSQHSMDPAGIFATSPGWRIFAPSTPFDYVGMMNTALACRDPVLILEHVDLYVSTGLAPADDLDYFIPFGRAKVVREGSDLTVLTYLGMVKPTLDAIERLGADAELGLGVDAEVIDLRTLDRAGLDWETIGASIRKTHNVLIVEQGSIGTSYGGLLADEIQRRFLDWLDQPVQRVHGGEASPSVSKVLERAAIVGREEIEAGLRMVMAACGRPLAA
ncbi:alpha-ketoacid dehydrogenase subunit alpha/beta [Microvirga massiliensis]|uniref:alpha-ketoacid dehydrogenase subunit alpha/beta n=1 Tax=Microvirga massiliensis TaxID=1033741 RepID=UPI00062B6EA3|nr:alpha-ketoacid dehydrogenase subunit alpha/beta [Microvirga massiliensis]